MTKTNQPVHSRVQTHYGNKTLDEALNGMKINVKYPSWQSAHVIVCGHSVGYDSCRFGGGGGGIGGIDGGDWCAFW